MRSGECDEKVSNKDQQELAYKNNNLFAGTTAYDELAYIDEWIKYMQENNNSTNSSFYNEQEETSSFSSIMNFYKTNENRKILSSEDLQMSLGRTPEKKKVNIIENDDDLDIESINLINDRSVSDLSVVKNKIIDHSYVENDLDNTFMFSDTSKNKDNVKLKKSEIRPFKINITKIDSTIRINKAQKTEKPINQYFIEDQSPVRTFGLINEAKNRTIQQNKRSEFDVPLRKFVIETDYDVINIKDVYRFYDMKNKTIVGRLQKMGTKGYYTHNWVTIRETFFTCYSTKTYKKSSASIMNERNGDIEHPLDSSSFLKRKYTLDLLNCQIFMAKKKSKLGKFSCRSQPGFTQEELIDITNLVLLNIKQHSKGYTAILRKEAQIAEVEIDFPNFVIKTNDGYRCFKVDSINDFFIWIVAYKFRMNKIPLNIG